MGESTPVDLCVPRKLQTANNAYFSLLRALRAQILGAGIAGRGQESRAEKSIGGQTRDNCTPALITRSFGNRLTLQRPA
jgi:hypothetical protein